MTLSDHEFLLQLRTTFALEAKEYLQTIDRGLVDMEQEEDPVRRKQVIEEVFRAAHSMKGAAHTVDLGGIGTVCHALESILLAIKNETLVLQAQDFDTLQRTVNEISAMLGAPDAEAQTPDQVLLAALDEIISHGSGAPTSRAFSPKRPNISRPGRAYPAADQSPPASSDQAPTSAGDAGPAADTATANAPDAPSPPVHSAPSLSDQPEAAACVEAPAPESSIDPGAKTIRISADKLDSILLRAEELVSIKLALEQRNLELAEILNLFDPWKRQWQQFQDRANRLIGQLEQSAPGFRDKDMQAVFQGWDWNQSQLIQLGDRLEAMHGALTAQTHGAGQLITDLQETAKSVLMLPAATLLAALPRTVRNIARSQGKEAVITSSGTDIEVDKRILERIKDPLIHLVRNCLDHGLETPDHRRNKGKPAAGTINIAFSQVRGNLLRILVSDDGAGMDVRQVRESALKRGLVTPEEAATMDQETTLKLILRSGVSTSKIITDISGRGLGMAIVLEAVENLGGEIHIQTEPDRGTVFRIDLPIFMAGFRGLLVREYDQVFAIPTAHVATTLRVRQDAVYTLEGRDTIVVQHSPLPLLRLGRILEMDPPHEETSAPAHLFLVVLQAGDRQIACAVDAVLNEQEILIKSLGPQLVRVRNVSGAAVLGSGRVVAVLNVNDVLRSAIQATGQSSFASHRRPEAPARRKILVAEDSITSRTLLKNILTAAGYEVQVAVDGAAAWEILQQNPFDVVISDVEMPHMNGFDLTAKIRSVKRTAHIPVILVTSLESRQDKERGIDVGADAYVVKSSFDQSNLLEILHRLVGGPMAQELASAGKQP